MKIEEIKRIVESKKFNSAWSRGVKEYALELLDNLYYIDELTKENCVKTLRNGADSWLNYSYGGCSLIYDEDIAKRLCTPSELERTRYGKRMPNKYENWLDVQERALIQASNLIYGIVAFN